MKFLDKFGLAVLWVKCKSTFQPKGNYAASSHTHDNVIAAYTHGGALRHEISVLKSDNGGRDTYILIADITGYQNVTSGSPKFGFAGLVLGDRGDNGAGNLTYCGNVVATQAYNSLRTLYSDVAHCQPVVVTYNSRAYIALRLGGSAHRIYLSGRFWNCLSSFQELLVPAGAELPTGMAIVASVQTRTLVNTKAASAITADSATNADKIGNYPLTSLFRKIGVNGNLDSIADDSNINGIYYINASVGGDTTGHPFGCGSVVNFNNGASNWQLGASYNNALYFRQRWFSGGNGTWMPWRRIAFTSDLAGYASMEHTHTDFTALQNQITNLSKTATPQANGLMTAADKTKLNSIMKEYVIRIYGLPTMNLGDIFGSADHTLADFNYSINGYAKGSAEAVALYNEIYEKTNHPSTQSFHNIVFELCTEDDYMFIFRFSYKDSDDWIVFEPINPSLWKVSNNALHSPYLHLYRDQEILYLAGSNS